MTEEVWTEVTDVESITNNIVVFIGRTRHYINPGDELTFVGDDLGPDLFQNGETYQWVGADPSDEPTDAVKFERVDGPGGQRVKVYNEDVRYYLLNGCFLIHDA